MEGIAIGIISFSIFAVLVIISLFICTLWKPKNKPVTDTASKLFFIFILSMRRSVLEETISLSEAKKS